MKKNDLVNLDIIDTTLQGAGVGKSNGLTIFVDSAVTGDSVVAHILKVKQNCAFAKIHEKCIGKNAHIYLVKSKIIYKVLERVVTLGFLSGIVTL